jgi:hypothetical protein
MKALRLGSKIHAGAYSLLAQSAILRFKITAI